MFVSTVVLLVSAICLVATQWRWRHAKTLPLQLDLRASLREGRWSHVCSLLLIDACDAILGIDSRPLRSFWRALTFGTVLLIFVLSLTGLMTDQLMGFSDWPWNLFDQEMARFQRATANSESAQIHDLVTEARVGYWKFAYTALVLPLILLISGGTFWISLRSTRFFVRELETAQSWAQKAGLMLGLCVVTLFLANVAAFLVSALVSLNPLLMLVLVWIGLSDVFLVIGGVAINAFTLYLSDPWLRGLLVAAPIPSLIQLTLTVPALAAEMTQSIFRDSKSALTISVRKKLRGAFFTALMIISAGLFAYWFLGKIV
jgi:hypothetical protein